MPGAIFTLILILIILTYAGYKFNVLAQMHEYHVSKETYQYHFDKTDQFGVNDGFAIAAAITGFGISENLIEDERIGTIEFYLKSWVGNDDFKFTKLKSRQCREDDFKAGTGGTTNYGLYPLNR